MYIKLIFKNAKRSAKNYLVYMVTMTICVMLFYAFLSISSSYYKPILSPNYDLKILGDGMKMAICAITLLLLFLIRYVNNFMLMQKQKEFALQAVMGMEQTTLAMIFFGETLIMSFISIIIGIALGLLCSQFITAMLLTSYKQGYNFTWTLFPDTVFLTVVFFTLSILIIGLFNFRTIKKIPLIHMLYADKHNEPSLTKSKFMHIVTLLYILLLVIALINGIKIKYYYFDNRYALPVHIMFWANIISPILSLICPVIYLLRRKSQKFHNFIACYLTLSLINILAATLVPTMHSTYLLTYDSGVINQYLCFLLFYVIYLICGLIFLTNTAILAWKKHFPKHSYKGQNLFLIGQITSKLTTNTKTMILICLTLVLSISLFIIAPVLNSWSQGYLNIRSLYDLQISSKYNTVYDEKDLPRDDYDLVSTFLRENNISISKNCTFNLYLPKKEDFHKRVKYDFPIVAISLSDYNTLCEMLGYNTLNLKENEFSVKWQNIATKDARKEFNKTHQQIITDAGKLKLSPQKSNDKPMGETIYNSYTDAVYIFPDSICQQLLPVIQNRYLKTEKEISYKNAKELSELFVNTYPEKTTNKPSYYIRIKTLQVNENIASNFILKASMIYSAIILMIMCLTILSLQQLLDANKYKYRFLVLKKLGVDEDDIKELILKQLGIWFGIPIILAIIISTIIIAYFLQSITAQIFAYIGIEALVSQLLITISILTLLLICYFISTLMLFRKNLEE